MNEHNDLKVDDQKSSARLEHEADEVRARLGRTANELSARLSPGELLDQALRAFREHGGELGRNFGATAKQNPVPLALATIGISWLMMSSKSGSPRHVTGDHHRDAGHSDDLERRLSEGVSGAIDSARETFDDAKAALKDKASRVGDLTTSVRHEVRSASDNVRATAQRTGETLTHFFNEQPLIAGTVGLAVGATLGSLFPSTAMEDELMGRTRDEVVARAQSAASESYERVKDVASDAIQEVREEAAEVNRLGLPH